MPLAGSSVFSTAFRITMSFRMTAAMTTLEGFPAALSRAANAFIPGDTLRLSRTAFGETRGSAISLEFLRLAHTTSSLTRNEMQRGVSKSSNTMI